MERESAGWNQEVVCLGLYGIDRKKNDAVRVSPWYFLINPENFVCIVGLAFLKHYGFLLGQSHRLFMPACWQRSWSYTCTALVMLTKLFPIKFAFLSKYMYHGENFLYIYNWEKLRESQWNVKGLAKMLNYSSVLFNWPKLLIYTGCSRIASLVKSFLKLVTYAGTFRELRRNIIIFLLPACE